MPIKQNEYEIGKTIVYFVRHGDKLETENCSRIPGPGLSIKGHMQAKSIAKKFLKLHGDIESIYSSTMKRAKETASYIGKAVGKKPIYCEELCEFNRFLWDRKYYHPKFWKHYFRYSNAQQKFNKILMKHKGEKIIIVAHGNIIKGIIGKKSGIPFTKRGLLAYDNCSVSKVRFNGTKFDYMYYYNASQV
jgi:broad specificity phosphatase PhoE